MSGVLHAIEQVGPSLTQALAWFVVQGLVIGTLALCVARLLHRRSANARYWMHVSAMLLMLVCLPVNLLVLPRPQVPAGPDAVAEVNRIEQPTVGSEALADSLAIYNEAVGHASDVSDSDPVAMFPEPVKTDWPEGTEARESVAGVHGDGSGGLADWDEFSAWLPPPFDAASDEPQASIQANVAVSIDPEPTLWQQLSPWVVGIYLAGLIVFLLRLLAALRGGQQLRRAALPAGRKGLARMVFEQQAQRLGIAAKRMPRFGLLPEHFSVAGPLLIGLIKPMVLLPAVAVTQLTPAQLEAVLAHELAHLKRYDPCVLLLQRVIETLLFFHPMVWVISSRVSVERENACDDMVLATGVKPADYASALVMFLPITRGAGASASMTPVTAVAAVSSSRSLRQRILRLFGEPTSTPVRLTRKGLAACATMVLLSAVMVVLACQSVGTPHSGGDLVAHNQGVAEEPDTGTVASEDRLYWSTTPVSARQGLLLDGPAGDVWPLTSDDLKNLFDKNAAYAVVLNESDWHALSPEELIAIVDATTNDQQPSHIAQLFSDETIAPTPGLPGEQVYSTRVFGYRTSSDTYGMVRIEEHPFAALKKLAEADPPASGYGAETPPRFAQVKRSVEEPDRFDIAWDPSIPALDMRAGDPELEFLGDNLMQTVYDSRFAAEAGATYVLTARSAVGMSALEVFLDDGTIHEGPTKVLATGHDRWYEYNRAQGVTKPNRDRCIRLVWTATKDGTYAARVRFDDRDPDRVPKLPSTGGYTLDIRCLTTRPKVSSREADSVPYDAGAIQRIELAGSAVLHKNSPPRLGLYYLPDMPEASFRLFDLLIVSGFDLNQVPYHRFDVLRLDTESGETKRLIDVPVFFAWQLGRDVTKASEPTVLQPGDKVVVHPRDLFKGEAANNLDREALGWGLPVNGLACRWKQPEVEIQPGQETVPLTVQVRNVSDQPIVWKTHWQVGRLSREEMAIALFEPSQQPTSLSVVAGWDRGKVRYAYQRGGRTASEHEVKRGPALAADALRDLPGGRVHYQTGSHFLSPGAMVEMGVDYPVERLARVGGDGGDVFGMPDKLFAEVYRYDPIHGPNRPIEQASMTGPPLKLRVLPGEADKRPGLGPVIERDMSRREQYLDLDTGEHVDPASLNEAAEWGIWIIGPKGNPEGRVNLFHSVLSSNSQNLSGRHVELVLIDGLAFDEVTAKDIEACWDEDGFVAAGKEARGGFRGITTRDGPHAFRTLAGKRGVVELAKAEGEGRRWTVRLRHLPGKQPFTRTGEPTEGISLHLHGVRYRVNDSRRIKQADGTTRPGITFNLRARHDGNAAFLYAENPLIYLLEVDGKWYIYAPPVKGEGAEQAVLRGTIYASIQPMDQPAPFAMPMSRQLGGHWYELRDDQLKAEAIGDWQGSKDFAYAPELFGDSLVLTPGKHTLRIAIGFGPDHRAGSHTPVRVISNPMTIRVPGEKGARKQPVDREAWHQLLTDVAQDKIDLEEAARRAEKIAASGLDPDTQDNRGFRPLPDLLSHNHWWYDRTTPEERLALVRLLIKHGADPDLPGSARRLPPLHLAADNFEPEMVRLLGELGADPNRRVGLIAGEWGAPLHRVAWYIGSRYRVNRTEDNLAKLDARAIPTIEALLAIGADPWLRAYTRGTLGAGAEIQTPIDLCPLGKAHDLLLAVVEGEHDRLQAEVTTLTAELLQAVLDKNTDTISRYLHDNSERGYFVLQDEALADSVVRHFREGQYLLGVDQIDTEALFDHVYARPDVASVLLRTEATNNHILLVLFNDGRRWGLSWMRSIPRNLNVREGMKMRMLASVGGALDHRNRPWLNAQRYQNIGEVPPLQGGTGAVEQQRETDEMRVTISPDGGPPSIVFLKAGEQVGSVRLFDGPGEHLLFDLHGRGATHVREVKAHDWYVTLGRIQKAGSPIVVAWDAAGQLFTVDAEGKRHAAEQITIDLKANQVFVLDKASHQATKPVKPSRCRTPSRWNRSTVVPIVARSRNSFVVYIPARCDF